MGTRTVKDAVNLETGEKIYFKGHAKATYMSDGRTVEDAIRNSSGGGNIYNDLEISKERFAELLNRDFYCPQVDSEPTEETLTYVDTDGSVREFAVGQECVVSGENGEEPVFYKFAGLKDGNAVWVEQGASSDTPVVQEVVDLSMQDIYGNTIAQTTANCYVVKEEGLYKFPLVFGNAIEKGSVNYPSFTNNGGEYSHDFVDYTGVPISSPYIEEVSASAESVQLSIADTDGVFSEMELVDGVDCKYVQFKVDSVPPTGANGVISVKDADGTIMWSWHIWVWKDDLSPVGIMNSSGVQYNILPVNLGSKWDDSTKTHIKNWFYQWGRPTPMLCPATYNSTQNHASYGELSFAMESVAENIQAGIRNPNKFYYNNSSPYNWFGTASYYNLWDANCATTGSSDNIVVKTVYDPCPVGFKMPNGNTFTYFSTSNVVGNFSNGWRFKRYLGDTTGVFFPASGYRNISSGNLYSVGSGGFLWLSSANSKSQAYCLYFVATIVNPQNYSQRAYGNSVRPVKDGNFELPTHKVTININGDLKMPEGYKVSIYKVNSGTSASGEYVEELGDLIAEQTTASETYEIEWGTSYRIISDYVLEFDTPETVSHVADAISRSVLLTYKNKPFTDLSKMNIYGDAITQDTANCYVVQQTGRYKFPLVFGNAIKNGMVNAAAYTNNGGQYCCDFVDYNGTVISTPYIEELSGTVEGIQLSIADTDGVFTDMGIMSGEGCRYAWVEISSVPDTGANGVISIKDAEGVIMWSWHIWVWPYSLETVQITNASGLKYDIMPVNLATKLDSASAINGTVGWKNWFYNWGRPTPYICPAAHNLTYAHSKYGVLSNYSKTNAADLNTAIQNPTTRYKGTNSWTSSNKIVNLWDASCQNYGYSDNNVIKTVYDPCPVGFKIPNGRTFSGCVSSNVVGSFNSGYYFKKNASDTTGIFLPATGYIKTDFLSVAVSGNIINSALYNQEWLHCMFFNKTGDTISWGHKMEQYTLGSVRPVKE